jgi:CBS domain-containing protein
MPEPMSVEAWMSGRLVSLSPDMDVLEAIATLLDNRISGAPVVDRLGRLVGMLSEVDCLKVALNAGYHGEWGGHVEEFMSREVTTVEAAASVLDVARMFVDTGFRRFPVVKDERLVGQISRRDVLRALQSLRKEKP